MKNTLFILSLALDPCFVPKDTEVERGARLSIVCLSRLSNGIYVY